MFDRTEVAVRGGDGGNGAVSFRREKFVPFGGPDGGDGGDGGDVILIADTSVTSLNELRYGGSYKAGRGGHGSGKRKHGKNGGDLVLAIPPGTIVWYRTESGRDELVADLAEPGQSVIVARGGEGGWGNTHFASSTNKSPRIAKKGGTDEEHSLVLELRLIADAGIVGYPNVGKSALLAAASAAKPKIADYAFTTRQPELGVVEVGNQRFTLAEIPGLIDGAHLGRGLGHDFLRHAMRTKMLIHVVDGSSASPVEDMVRVNNELTLFDSSLSHKPQLVAVNKIDLPQVRARLAEIEAALIASGNKPHFISALTGAGVPELMAETARVLQSMATEGRAGEPLHKKVFRPQPRGRAAQVTREGDIFVVIAPELERIIAGSDVSDLEVQLQLRKQLARMGISRTLEKAGVKPGDKVRCGELELEW